MAVIEKLVLKSNSQLNCRLNLVFARVDNQRQSRNEFYLIQERYFRPKLNNVHLVEHVVNKTSKLEQNVKSDI